MQQNQQKNNGCNVEWVEGWVETWEQTNTSKKQVYEIVEVMVITEEEEKLKREEENTYHESP